MSNEPVAIVKKMTISGIDNFLIERFTELKEGTLLYTHPTDPTDEEIEEFAKKAGVVFDERYKGEVTFISREALKRFAKAILRKAQEK